MDVDHARHVALVAIHGEACIGVVRYVGDSRDPTLADFAITVIDANQGPGVRRLTVDIHPENRAMQHLARSLGAQLRLHDGVLSGTLRLPLAYPVGPALPAAA